MLQDLRFGLRTLLKSPGFTLVAVAVLALGIGANTAMFTLVNATLFRPLAGRVDEMVGLYSHDRTKADAYRAFSYPNYADIRDRNDVFAGLMAHTYSMVGVPAGDTTRQVFTEVVSANYFETLGVPLSAGRPFSAEEERPGAAIPVVIVAHDRAALLGQTIEVNSTPFTVVGVAPPGFTGTMALVAGELWLPLGMFDTVVTDMFKTNGSTLGDRANPTLILAGRLKPGIATEAAAARLDVLSRQMEQAYPAENKDQLLTVSPLPRLSTSTSPRTDAGVGVGAAFLMGIAGVVMLIACLNIANMLLARGASRRREIAIRLAVGGSRGRIVSQLITEGLLLAVAGAGAGLLLAYWATSALAASLAGVFPLAIEFDAKPDAMVMAATTAFAILATLMFGIGPAFTLSRADLVGDLKDQTGDRSPALLGRRFSARNVLVVGQIALSLMLLSAGGLFARGALKAAAANPGFSYDRQVLAGIDPALAQIDETRGREMRRAALERLRRIPGVEAVGIASSVPFGEFHEGQLVERVGAADGAQPISSTYRIVGADYFRALNLPMIRGREFTASEEDSDQAPRVAIIDRALAVRLFGSGDPLGQMIRFGDRPGAARAENPPAMEVVGVAAPIRDDLFDREAEPSIYVPSGRTYRSTTHMHIRVAHVAGPPAVLDAIRQELRAVDARLPIIQVTTLQSVHDRSVSLWAVRAGGRMFMLFGLLALLLAVVGLYGVKSYVVAQRTREIGIRMALGARPGEVLRMVLREGAWLAAAGMAIGIPLAALLGRALGSVLFDVKPFDPVVFTSTRSCTGRQWLRARRATKADHVPDLARPSGRARWDHPAASATPGLKAGPAANWSRVAVIMKLAFGALCGALVVVGGLHGRVIAQAPPAPFPVAMRVDAGAATGPLKPIWRFFGADEPNYAYMKDGQTLIAEQGKLSPGRVYFRAHNLLTTGDGTPALKWGSTNAYREDAQGNPIYDWTIVDRIFDTYLKRGVKPYVQIGFMPKDMSTNPEPYQHSWTPTARYDQIYTGWAYPPKDFKKWGDLAYAWAKHAVEKYGRAEVETWYWEVWNEANIGYWRGTPEEFRKLHDYAIDGVKRALPTARVGGADTAGSGGQFTRDFIEHALRGTNFATGKTGTPLDFVSFHAKGSPAFVDGHVRLGISNQLSTIDQGFRIVASYPELKQTPIVIGESDPDGCAACQGPQLGYRNTTMFSSYTAAVFARKHDLAERHGVNLEGALTWAFQFEGYPLFAGFRALASGGLDLPVFNVFRMFSRMGPERLAATSDAAIPLDAMMKSGVRERPDVSLLASRDARKVSVLAWHYHDDDLPGPAAQVTLTLDKLAIAGGQARVQQFRIDRDHSNAYTAWQAMGSPATPSPAQYAQLLKAGQLTAMDGPSTVRVENSSATVRFELPRQGVSLFVLEW